MLQTAKGLSNREYIIITTNQLEQWHLNGILVNSIDAIRIPNYYSKEISKVFSKKIRINKMYGHYVNAPLIGRMGQAFFECQSNKESLARYKRDSLFWLKNIRHEFYPYQTPIDRIRVELDEIWPAGSQLAKIGDIKLFAGLAREFNQGSYAEPHNDVLSWDIVDGQKTDVINQIAFNVYLDLPEEGGELVLWNDWLSQEEYSKIRNGNSYGVNREKLSGQNITIVPQLGELIMFNPMRIHSVEKIYKGSRVTWSCFIGFSDIKKPLVIWS